MKKIPLLFFLAALLFSGNTWAGPVNLKPGQEILPGGVVRAYKTSPDSTLAAYASHQNTDKISVDLSPRAQRLYNYWSSRMDDKGFPLQQKGPIKLRETPNSIDLDITLADYRQEADVLKDNVLRLRYEIINDEQMSFTAKLPRQVWLHDEQGVPHGLFRFADQDINGIWSDELEGPVDMELLLADAEFLPDAGNTDKDSQEIFTIEKILLTFQMEQGAQSLWNGRGKTEASNIRLLEGDNGKTLRIGSAQYDIEFKNHDLNAFSGLMLVLTGLADDSDWRGFSQVFENLLLAYGEAQFTVTVKDIAAEQIKDMEFLSLELLKAEGEINISAIDPNQRNFSGNYHIRELKVRSEETDMNIGSFTIESGLAGLNMVNVSKLAENPLEFFAEFQNLVQGIHFGFSASGLQGRHEDMDLSDLADVAMSMSIFGLNTSIQDFAFKYQHSGLKQTQAFPAELTPGNLAFGFQFSGVPVLALIGTTLMGGEDVKPMVLTLFAQHGSNLVLDILDVTFPQGSLRLDGIASVVEPGSSAAGDMPVVEMDAVFDVCGIEALAEAMSRHMDSEEDSRNLKAVVAFIKLAAEEKNADDGSVIHHLRIKSNNQGEITANGKDLTPLLNLMNQ
jgi:hypothetical protein